MNSGRKNISAFYSQSWKLSYSMKVLFPEGLFAEKNPSEINAICATYQISYNYEFDDLGDGSGLKADCDICFSTHPPRPLVSGTLFCRH